MSSSINRRSFLKRLAGTGALLAVSELPSWGEDNPQLFSARGKRERMSISYAQVNIGLEKPFSVLHISDTHLTAAYPHESEKKQQLSRRRTKTFGGMQEDALRESLIWAKKNTNYVIHTGDIIDWQSEANFDLVNKYFGRGDMIAPGNHEFSPDMKLSDPPIEPTEAFKDTVRPLLRERCPYDIDFASQVVHGVNFITFDNVFGYVTREQVEKFHREAAKGLPMVLCMHVPFFNETLWRMHCRYWMDEGPIASGGLPEPGGDYKRQLEDAVTREFLAWLKELPLLKCILTGHEHFTMEDQFSPTCRQYIVGSSFHYNAREVIFL
ncbi:MAG: metallophosphoesterase [Bacteroidales bacterium]|nr:metallophosphoesterase [Bacteroidales bacterium]